MRISQALARPSERRRRRGGGLKSFRRRAVFRWRATPSIGGGKRRLASSTLIPSSGASTTTDYTSSTSQPPLGPMAFTDAVYKNKGDYELCEAVNIFSVKIASSDVGFPIHVYGTVIARDSIDEKCLYLFRRDRDHCQLINFEDESLILTGPKRGLALLTDNYVETDLKIKDHQGQDRELSKGILTIRGIAGRSLKKCEVESKSLATRLSTVDVMYAVVKCAVEATIAIEVLQGDFYGKITAHTTSIQNSLVLYDSEVVGAMTGDRNEVIQLMRPVVSVYVKDMLTIVARTGDGKSECTIQFTPRVNSRDEDELTVGVTKLRFKVAWSIMDP
ncbi:uncharacterized protein LOC133905748 [Phragmites australis]|uniref:uncharacterized protein LOC133905748 n=1 Tax=Phragmites australis TaxID=29695 RepID=UPI002D791005|nr:uncharacterized protein LOC133905748 [Phragmites australis]